MNSTENTFTIFLSDALTMSVSIKNATLYFYIVVGFLVCVGLRLFCFLYMRTYGCFSKETAKPHDQTMKNYLFPPLNSQEHNETNEDALCETQYFFLSDEHVPVKKLKMYR